MVITELQSNSFFPFNTIYGKYRHVTCDLITTSCTKEAKKHTNSQKLEKKKKKSTLTSKIYFKDKTEKVKT